MLATHTDEFAGTLTEEYETPTMLRHDRIRTARRRLAEGRYDREELLDEVLEAIIEDIA